MTPSGPQSVPRVLFLGAGQQVKLILHILGQAGQRVRVVGLLDDDPAKQGHSLHGAAVLGPLNDLAQHAKAATHFAVGIGNIGSPATMRLRRALFEQALAHGLAPLTALHPKAHIDPTSKVGGGAVIHPGVAVNPFTVIGQNCVLFTNASVDHDCVLHDNVYISPGVSIGGNVTIHRDAFLGIGASLIQGVTVGEGAVIGAGAVVTKDVPPHVTTVGVPARVIKTHPP